MSTTNSFPINKSESKSNSVIHHAEFSCFFLRRNHALSNFKIGHTLLQTTNQDDKYLLELICNNTETTLDEVILVISLSPLFFKTHQLSLSGMVSLKERNLSYREIMYLKVLFAHVEKDSYLQQVSAFYQFISAVHEEQQLISLKKQNGKFNNSQIIEYIERLIDLHLLDNKLPTIDNMAKELGISTSKFKLVTAQYYNQGIYQHYLNLKFEASKDILLANPVGVTANSIGFKVVSKYIIGFKKRYNLTPYKYKQLHCL